MKLHLNLTLRRAVLAAMALVAVHTTQAQDIVPDSPSIAGPSTIGGGLNYGNQIVNVGNYEGPADYIIADGKYSAYALYIGGRGFGENAEYGNNGTLTVDATATLSATDSINVGSTKVTQENGEGIVGKLIVDGGKVTSKELNVGVNKGSGNIKVSGGGKISATDALKMGFYNSDISDSNSIAIDGTGSSLTVGEAGGNNDFTSIGAHTNGSISIGNGASATFYDQTIIGENANSHGSVTVTNQGVLPGADQEATASSTLTLGTKTVLGYKKGAFGSISVDGSKVTGTEMVVGSAGKGELLSKGNSTIELKTLFLGQQAGSTGELTLSTGDKMTISNALTIGNAGTGTAEITDAKLDITKNLIIGNTGTGTLKTIGNSAITVGENIVLGSGDGGSGSMSIGAKSTVEATKDLFVGNNKGTSSGTVTNAGELTAANAYIMGTDSSIANSGTMKVKDTTIYLGSLTTEADAETTINGKLEVSGGKVTNDGILTAGDTKLTNTALTTGTGSKTTINGKLEVSGGSVTNNGTLPPGDTLTAGYTLAAGDTKLTNTALTTGAGSGTTINGKLEVSGGSVTNDGTLTAGNTSLFLANVTTGTGSNTTIKGDLTVLGGTTNIGGKLEVTSGSAKLTSANFTTEGGSETTIAGDLTILGGTTTIGGSLTAGDTIIDKDAEVEIAQGGAFAGTGNIVSAAAITNDGTLTNSTGNEMILGGLSGTGQVQNDGNWFVYGSTEAGIITNNGSITIQGAGNIIATSVNGDITIIIDKYSVSTATDGAVVERYVADNTDNVKIKIDLSDAYALTGKSIDFVKDATGLASFKTTTNGGPITYTEGWQADWINGIFSYTEEGSNKTTRLNFTTTPGDEENTISGIDFATVSQHTTYTDATDTSKSVEIVTEVKSTEAEIVDSATTTITPSTDTLVEGIGTAETIQTATITTGSATISSEDHRIAFSKDVVVDLSAGAGGKVEITTNTVIAKDSTDELLLDAIGHTITISGDVTYTGNGISSQLGFEEKIKDNEKQDLGDVTIAGDNYKLKELDVLVVAEDATVTFQGVNMHITHAGEFKAGSTVTFEGCNIEFGGTIDHNIFKEVIVKDTDGNALKDENDEDLKHVVESDNHLTTKSSSEAGATIILKNTTIKFKEIKDDENGHIGSVVLPDTVIETAPDCTLGGAKKDGYMTLHFENSHIGGSGKLENAIISGGKFRVGSSPTTRTVTDILVQNGTILEFNIITNSQQWYSYTGDSSQLSPTGHASGAVTNGTDFGAISQLEVTGPVTLNNVVFKISYETGRADAGNYIFESTTATSTPRKFEDGDSIQFIVFNGGSITGTFGIDYDSLPALADEEGTWWDFSTLLKDGKITVISELMEDPGRIANTLLSAGHTVLDFGRLSEAQAELRAKGTTRTWGSAIANFDKIDSKDGATGYDYNAWGGAVGVDHAFTDRTVVGIALARTYGENEPEEGNGYYDGGSIDQDGTMVGLYGTHKFKTKGIMNDVKFNAFAAYGWFDNESTRNGLRSGAPATASWDSDAWVLSASLSRDITTDHDIVFSTYAGVEYTKATMDDFEESNGKSTASYTADEDYSNLAVKVGVTVSKSFGGFTPYVGIAYVHDVKRDIPTVTAVGRRVITEEGCVPGRSAVQLKAGANWKLTETLDIFAGYSAEIRDNATEHNANLGMGLTF